MLKAGRTSAGAKAAASHTGALAGNDKIYEDVLKQSGVIRARSLRQLLEFARGIPVLPTPKGENVVIITGAGGSGVLLSDAVVDNGLSLMSFPPDLDEAFKKFIPPFGASGNPVDITGGEPPKTYQNTVRLGLEDDRIHALILGYWHTIVTPPMVFAKLMVEVVEEMKAEGQEQAGRRLAGRRRRGRGSRGVPLPARHPGLRLLDRAPGRGARREVQVGARRGPALSASATRRYAKRGEGDPIAPLVGDRGPRPPLFTTGRERCLMTGRLTPWTNYEHSSSTSGKPNGALSRPRSVHPGSGRRKTREFPKGRQVDPQRAGRGAGASRRPPAPAPIS